MKHHTSFVRRWSLIFYYGTDLWKEEDYETTHIAFLYTAVYGYGMQSHADVVDFFFFFHMILTWTGGRVGGSSLQGCRRVDGGV